ncbi:MAG: hypothetical protein C0399_12520 [Syntrophus sp. (in: bacteria)]|nr:hypothetical protein [Syntrophus sp. (in: bacteria)]
MSQIGYLFLGWLLGVLSMLIAKLLQHREDRQKKEVEIISEVILYLFKVRDSFNSVLSDRLVLEKSKNLFPDKIQELERNIYTRIDTEFLKDFFPNLMFHSFQLKRMKDKTLWKDFEALMGKYEELGKTLMDMADASVIDKLNRDIMSLTKGYVEKCLIKTKV